MTGAGVQLDLFGGDPEVCRRVGGLTALRDVVPEALEAVVHLREWRSRAGLNVSRSGAWWYGIRQDGLHFERVGERSGRGWPHKLTSRLAWDELAGLIGADPRRPAIVSWSGSLAEPAWRERMRPHELWPDPEGWHPSYITGDHAHPGWPERIAAWRAVQAMCTDAITKLEATPRLRLSASTWGDGVSVP
ncbi:hypothetical protein [Actinomadura sp. 3N407]|uniref:hypothetical protein n=1 Tax=Actinomadura sp. 3N407 TaxID=3457423 RepID=UPI003FCC7282